MCCGYRSSKRYVPLEMQKSRYRCGALAESVLSIKNVGTFKLQELKASNTCFHTLLKSLRRCCARGMA